MADLNVNLKKTLDGPGPQHKVAGQAAVEFSEGSNGALHTKVTDPEGNPIDPREVKFPQNQDVTDAQVKSELEAIKQTQTEILAKLNGTINTQSTGRTLKITTIQNQTIPAGTTLDIIQNYNFSNGLTQDLLFTFYSNILSSELEITIEFSRISGDFGTNTRCWSEVLTVANGGLKPDVKDTNWGYSLKQDILGTYMRLRIKNKSSSDKVFRSGQLIEIQPKGVN